jgi:hypothetical protein
VFEARVINLCDRDIATLGGPDLKTVAQSINDIVFHFWSPYSLYKKEKNRKNSRSNHPMIDLHDRHHHLPRPFPPLAGHRDEEETTTKDPCNGRTLGIRELVKHQVPTNFILFL